MSYYWYTIDMKERNKLEAETESKTKISIKIIEINNNAINKVLKSLKLWDINKRLQQKEVTKFQVRISSEAQE